jgi:hypothetical protein
MLPRSERRLANKAAAALFPPASREGASRPHPPGGNRGDYKSVSEAQKWGVSSSVADPWHFGVDPDPDPRIHASD